MFFFGVRYGDIFMRDCPPPLPFYLTSPDSLSPLTSYLQVSAKNGYGVSDAFYTLAVDIVQAMEAANRRGSDDRRAAR